MKELFTIDLTDDGIPELWVKTDTYQSEEMEHILTGCIIQIANIAIERYENISDRQSFLYKTLIRTIKMCKILENQRL